MTLAQRKTPRAQRYDYTSPGGYFITICTKDREHYFGEVIDGKMILNELGQYTTEHRRQISSHYPMVDCHEFVCMPNHIHGILIIRDVGTQFLASDMTDPLSRTYKNTSLQQSFIPKSGSLGAIIRGFKIGVTKYAREHDIVFAWQGRYHDHIIRDEQSYNRIKYYIRPEGSPLGGQTNPEHRSNDSLR